MRVCDFLEEEKIFYQKDADIQKYTTFYVSSVVKILVFPNNLTQLCKIVDICTKEKIRYVLLGNGSNVLFSSNGFDGVVIVTKRLNSIQIDGNLVTASTGSALSALINHSAKNCLGGSEFLVGVPGTVGGAVAMNASAFSYQISDFLVKSTVYDVKKKKIMELTKKEHCFSLKDSIFQNDSQMIVLSSTFSFLGEEKESIEKRKEEYMIYRQNTQPAKTHSAGSYFKRGEDGFIVSRAIDELGLKGYSIGGAEISKKHAGFIINSNHATSDDILALEKLIREAVKEKYQKEIFREVILIR